MKNKRSRRKNRTSVGRSARELIGAAMKKQKLMPGVARKFAVTNGGRAAEKNGVRSGAEAVFQYPRTELETAIQRYLDLFDFPPIGYVTFDPVGCVEKKKPTRTKILRGPPNYLNGPPFSLSVPK